MPTKAPSPIEVRVVNPLEDSAWDENLRAFPNATVFHTAGWAAALHEAYGYRPLYLTAHRDHRLVGVLPLMEVNSRLTGIRGVSVPFTDFCPALVSDSEALDALRAEALSLGRTRHWKTLELRSFAESSPARHVARSASGGSSSSSPSDSNSNSSSNSPLLRFQVSPPEADPPPAENSNSSSLSHSLDLCLSPDALFAACSSSHRRAIRKSEKAGLAITSDASPESLRIFCRLNGLTRRDHGLPPQPFAFFQALQDHVLSQGHGFITVAFHDKTPVAASVFLQFGENAVYKYGASDRRHQGLRASNRVMWEGIQACIRSGATRLSMGKTNTENEGLLRFKRGWGGQEQDLLHEKTDITTGENLAVKDGVFGWHNHIFKHLPIPVNRLIGTMLYRHIG